MKKTILIMCASLVMSAFQIHAQSDTAVFEVVPLPENISLQKGSGFILSDHATVSCGSNDAALQRDARFLSDYVKQLMGINLDIVSSGGDIQLVLDRHIAQDEGYKIVVKHKRVTISGRTSAGVFYGIQTLRKSLKPGAKSVVLPAVIISDAPRFGYRGMMLDCARHFFPVKFVKEYIDMLALHNMNRFHWHLSDDQGWRIEIKKYPRLTEVGSKRDMTVIGHNCGIYDSIPYGGYYTQDEAREIVKYAAERYITVIPEIDMPGHMQGALAAYPELGCTGGPYNVWRIWGISQDVLCLGNEKTYTFCQDVLKELMDIFPSEYIHIGGDETPTSRWEHCPKCKALAERQGISTKHLQDYFTHRMEAFANEQKHHIIGWDEVLQSDKVLPSTTIMSWRGVQPGIKAAKKGHDVIMSPTSYCYFDYYQISDKEDISGEPLLIGGRLPIEKTYSFEPCPDSLSAETKARILGVQANLWTEYIAYPSLAQYQVLPRMGALSEIQWMQPKNKNFDSFRKRSLCLRRLYDAYKWSYNHRLWK